MVINFTVLFDQSAYCSGGNGECYAQAGMTPVCLFDQSLYCSGGGADGYSSDQFNGAMFSHASYCSGGDGNGYKSIAMPADTLGNVIWKGIINASWTNASNWTNNVVPDINTDVTIPPFVPFYPALTNILAVNYSTGTYKCKSLFSGGTLSLLPMGTIKLGNQSSGPAYCDLKINNGGTLNISGGTLEIDDQLNLMSGGTFNMTGGCLFVHRLW
jgi:hypothetical protein